MKSGNLYFQEPFGQLQACKGTALPLPLPFTDRQIQDTIKSSWADGIVKLRKFPDLSGPNSVATLKMGTQSVLETLGQLSHLEAALCPRCFCWIPSPWELQDLQIQDRTLKQASTAIFRKFPDVLLRVFAPLPPMASYVLMNFVVFLPGCGDSVGDFWCWSAHEARLRCSSDMSGDIYIYIYIYIYEDGVPGWALSLSLLSTQTMVTMGKIPMVEPKFEPGTSWLVVRNPDH
jgi:hypothetical protein